MKRKKVYKDMYQNIELLSLGDRIMSNLRF